MNGRTNVHATGLVLGRVGLMLRGPSGSGKSLLALALIEAWTARGKSARLVAEAVDARRAARVAKRQKST